MRLPRMSSCRSGWVVMQVTKLSLSSANTRSTDQVFKSRIDTRPDRTRLLSAVFNRLVLARETNRRSATNATSGRQRKVERLTLDGVRMQVHHPREVLVDDGFVDNAFFGNVKNFDRGNGGAEVEQWLLHVERLTLKS